MFCLILSKLIRGNDALCLTTSLCCSLELMEKKKSAAFFCVKKCVWFSCNAMQCETMHACACIYHNQDRCSRSIDSSSVRWHLSKKSFTLRDFIYIQLFQEIVSSYTRSRAACDPEPWNGQLQCQETISTEDHLEMNISTSAQKCHYPPK